MRFQASVLRTLLRSTRPSGSAAVAPSRLVAKGVPAALESSSALLRQSVPIRSYSVSKPALASDLATVLANEYSSEEESGNMDMPEDLVSFKNDLEATWRIVDKEDDAVVHMFLKEKKVQLSFHCQDTIEPVDDVETEEDEEPPLAVRFTVTHTKAGKTLVVNCICDSGELKIEGVATTNQDVDTIHAQQGSLNKTSYEGPEFLELDEELQSAFYDYLDADLKIHSDVVAFIAMYTDFKEQQLYCQFLKDAKSIIS